jgi:hypothetical protein
MNLKHLIKTKTKVFGAAKALYTAVYLFFGIQRFFLNLIEKRGFFHVLYLVLICGMFISTTTLNAQDGTVGSPYIINFNGPQVSGTGYIFTGNVLTFQPGADGLYLAQDSVGART